MAIAGVLVFGSGRVAASPTRCPTDATSQGCPVPKRDLPRYLNIAGGNAGPAVPYLLGDAFRFKVGERARQLGGYDPGVCDSLLRSPDGRYLIYGTAHKGWPALGLLDLATGTRSLFQARACDPAWGQDGRIAYLRYSSYSATTGAYRGQIVVQRGLRGVGSIWTGEGAWANPIWAGASLLLGSDVGAVIPGPLTIFYGSHKSRNVDRQARGHGPFSTVVAVNPQGTEALLDTERLGQGGGATGSEDSATLLRISDDAVLSTAILNSNDSSGSSDITALAPDGSWLGDQIVTTDGVFWGGSSHPLATLITLTVNSRHVRLLSVKQFIQNGRLPMAQDLDQVTQATALRSDRHDVALWFKAIGQIRYLQCKTATDRCSTSRNYATSVTPTATFLTNPSRP